MFHLNYVMFIKKLEMSITPCFLITVPEGSEMDYEEEPEYTLESLFSDIGGAAGLALGMSLATFFGALEYLLYRLLLFICLFTPIYKQTGQYHRYPGEETVWCIQPMQSSRLYPRSCHHNRNTNVIKKLVWRTTWALESQKKSWPDF